MTDSAKTKNSEWKQFGTFFKLAHLSWGWIILSVAVTMVYYLIVTKLPGSTAALFSGQLTTKAITDVVINYASLLVAMATVSTVNLIAGAKSTRSVRRAVWARMMGIRADYYDEHNAGELLSAVTSDTEVTVTQLISLISTTPGLIMYLSQALPLIKDIHPTLMWSVFILIPFYILYAFLMGRWQYKTGMRIQNRIGLLTGFLTDRIRNLTLIKTFVTEEPEEQKGTEAARGLYKANIQYAKVNAVIVTYTILAEVIGIVIAVVWGCMLLRNKEIVLQDWLTFYLFVPTINTVFRQLTNIWSNLKDVQGRAARLGALMEAPQEEMNADAPTEIPGGEIRLENVSFAYREGTPVLNDVSFSIPEGKVTAVVGPSGSGKTTVIRLLEKLYTPSAGRITVGGKDLNELNLSAWRSRLSYVNQEAEALSGTIREALTYGLDRDVTDEELDRAVKTAGFDTVMADVAAGYDTRLSLWGGGLSGGQRQRLIIARELLRDSAVLLLDEPTSALDTETAESIRDTLFCGFDGKTIVAVTHELGFVAHADNIILLEGGRIAGRGTHSELLSTCETYRKLVEEQSYQEVFGK